MFQFEREVLRTAGFSDEDLKEYGFEGNNGNPYWHEGFRILLRIVSTDGFFVVEGSRRNRLEACVLFTKELWHYYSTLYVDAERLFEDGLILGDEEFYSSDYMRRTTEEFLKEKLKEITEKGIDVVLINNFNVEDFAKAGWGIFRTYLTEVKKFLKVLSSEGAVKTVVFLKEKTRPNPLKRRVFRSLGERIVVIG